jgi:hypothetical protein
MPPTSVPPTDVPATDVPATSVPPTAVPPTDVPPTPVPVSAPARIASAPTEAPSVEPTAEIVIVADDPNARSAITPVVRTPTPDPTQAPTPAPTTVPTTDQDLVGSVVAASMEPLFVGGRIGLILGGLAAAGFLGIQRLRRR